ncbi:hypothetical protein R6Q59_026575 [Mikania micrantha]
MENDVVVVVVPFVAQGHLNQLLHFSRLLSGHNLPVHIVGTTTHNHQAKLRIHGWNHNSDTNIHFHEFQTPEFESPAPNPNSSSKFPSHLIPSFKASSHLRDPFAKLLAGLSNTARRVVVVHDYLMSTVVQDVVSFPNAEAYVFNCASAFTVYSYVWDEKGRPCLDDDESYTTLAKIPVLEHVIPPEFLEFIYSNTICDKFNSGNIHDTCKVFDDRFIGYLSSEGLCGSKKQWALGPFNPVSVNNTRNNLHKCIEWLDTQAQDSVIYVSFGSTTSLSDEQIQELAIGLENSGQKFIWVLRDADKGFANNDICLEERAEDYLLKPVKLSDVWRLTNSILKTGNMTGNLKRNDGGSYAAWPMHSDQTRNATLITEMLKIGLNLGDWGLGGDQVVTSSVIEKSIQILMDSDEGKEMRKRAKKIDEDVRKSVEEEGVVTRLEIKAFVDHITKQ